MTDQPQWETQAQVRACATDLQVSDTQQASWRRAGLLPDVEQLPESYRGSTTRYPRGYCAQLRALVALKRQNSNNDFIGRRLWWAGYGVDDRYWRPGLKQTGRWLDKALSLPARYLARPSGGGTRAGDVPRSRLLGSVLTRISRRVKAEELPTLLQVLAEGGLEDGRDPFSEGLVGSKGESAGDLVAKAFNLHQIDRLVIDDRSVGIGRQLPSVWERIRVALALRRFEELAERSTPEIEYARDIARETLEAGRAAYAALRPVFPRFAALFYIADAVAYYLRPEHAAIMIFGIVRLQEQGSLLPLAEIIAFRENAQRAERGMAVVMRLRNEYPEFAELFTPVRVKASAVDAQAREVFKRELRRASLKAAARVGPLNVDLSPLFDTPEGADRICSSTALSHRDERG